MQSRDENFVTKASAQDELFGAARNEAIGQAPERSRQDAAISGAGRDGARAVPRGDRARVGRHRRERRRGEFGLNPRVTEFVLRRTATDTACPEPRTFTYGFTTPPSTAPHTWDATCEGTPENNGFCGDGIVDAERVASLGGDSD